MKKITLGLGLIFFGIFSNAQNALENLVVEKYYVSNAADSIAAYNDSVTAGSGASGHLPVGSVTYRVYADMLQGYNFQAIFGDHTSSFGQNDTLFPHHLRLSTTTNFYNNPNGSTAPTSWSRTLIKNTTGSVLGLDSWFSTGAAASNAYGILKSEDIAGASAGQGGANLFTTVSGNVLQNNAAVAGIPLTTQDGYWYSGAPTGLAAPGAVSISPGMDVSILNDGTTNGNLLSTLNGSIYIAGGSVGPDPATNKILIGQFTTNGRFCYEFNIQVGQASTGKVWGFVAEAPAPGAVNPQIQMMSLKGCIGGTNILPTISTNITGLSNFGCFNNGDSVVIAAAAKDTDGYISKVQFFVDGSQVGQDSVAPFQYKWKTGTAVTYTLTAVAIDNEGGQTTSSTLIINNCLNTAVQNNNSSSSLFNIYPNPVRDVFTLEIFASKGNSNSYSIYDLEGKTILHKQLGVISDKYIESIDISSFAAGQYIIELSADGIVASKKIIKE